MECHMYDGTKESKQNFEDATGIKPMRFAQAWLEEPGSRWSFFHFDYNNPRLAPTAAATGPQLVAQRLVELWAAKTKHWRTVSNLETKSKIVAKLARRSSSMSKTLPPSGQFTSYHPGILCKCKAAIDIPVLNDITGKRSGFLTGWRSKEDLVKAMLALWASHVRGWRSTSKTRREVRTRYHEELKSSGLLRIVENETGVQHALDPHKKDNDDDPLCRYVRVPGKEEGHKGTAVLYAKTEKGGGAGYQPLEFRPCHQECRGWKRVEIDLHEATGPFLEEDIARARVVRAEW
ncbi:hypothetical protein LTR78_004532 [Recurvomyces mirabilis]|uniref:Uncharacterized protein n=1 Tax=Recurvomyces mirabilis TaxID=574656 RepID=A0AAE0WPM0_9PEZI|nr:hypothetical protein LTR78_004532 [Recurvomyces mirabilis]KAK5152974.1 hypothetical protein LTS14_008082 [Recurvomyces mirabilis]